MLFKNKTVLLTALALVAICMSWAQNNPPEIIAAGNINYCPGSNVPIVSNVSITDPDTGDTTLDVVVIQISQGYSQGEDVLMLSNLQPNIIATWSAIQGELTLSGTASFSEYETAISAVVFQTSQTSFNEDKTISINLGNANYLPSTGHYYFYVSNEGIRWDDAKTAAENQTFFGLQGYLATITTAEESQLAGEQSPGTGWIGANDVDNEGEWKWVTGPEAGTVFWIGNFNGSTQNNAFSFWNNAEPNNFGGNEHYAHITDPSIGNPGSWNDLPIAGDVVGSPYHPQGYLVEFGGMPGDVQVNLSASTTIVMPKILAISTLDFCENSPVSITLQTNTDTVLWFDSVTSTTPIFNGFTFNPSIAATTNYWVTPVFSGCNIGAKTQITATINQQPIANSITILECNDNFTTNGIATFVLNNSANDISGAIPNTTVEFFEDSNLSNSINGEAFVNTTNPQTIYARVTNTNTGCSRQTAIVLEVGTNVLNNATLISCEDLGSDGITTFNLLDASAQLVQGLPPGINLEFYETLQDVELQTNALNTTYTNTVPFLQTLYVIGNESGNCYGVSELSLQVENLPETVGDSQKYYCLNNYPETINLSSGVVLNNSNYTYSWSTGDTQETIQINEIGIYSVTITNSQTQCETTRIIDVLPSNIATFVDVNVEDIVENNSIFVLVSGEGEYEFALDNSLGPYQVSNNFIGVSPGNHTVYVKDVLNNCGTVSTNVNVIGYPYFFTPNGDNKNETWSIDGLNTNEIFQVLIFNRFGKHLQTLNNLNPKWDGRYKGALLPTSDYWFSATLQNGKNFTGHFTLKR